MEKKLKNIKEPKDLKGLSTDELASIATEVRELIIDTVSATGGHLASSLGAVDITIALNSVFNPPDDKFIWDVGHQAYAHKIITGRRDEFPTLRQKGGISGFPKPSESPFDAFISGHSATSISAGLGMATAFDMQGSVAKVVAIIGDGSMTAGLAFEGLNQAGHLKKDLIVILNDNEMSIAKNVGALSNFLSKKITGRFAMRVKKEVEGYIEAIPKIGKGLVSLAKRAEDSLITLLTPGMLFEGLGFHYVGPIDGHNLDELINTFEYVKDLKEPVLIHVITKKGKGFALAEEKPSKFHGIGPFDKITGEVPASEGLNYTGVFGSAIIEAAKNEDRVVAITAAMPDGTGLSNFAEVFPDRFFDVGIAEQHAVTFAAGLAKEGFIPVTALYSTFLQRGFDSVIHDVCLQGLPVIFALDRAGIVGADGPTHHGIFDISFLRPIPGIVICAPRSGAELRNLLLSSLKYNCPVAIRYPRGGCEDFDQKSKPNEIKVGKGEELLEGTDLTILALGTMVEVSLKAAKILEKSGVSVGVIDARFVKPLDKTLLLGSAKKTGKILTVEEGSLQGGFGSAVMELFEEEGVKVDLKRLGIPDKFIEHGTQAELRSELGLDPPGIVKAAELLLDNN